MIRPVVAEIGDDEGRVRGRTMTGDGGVGGGCHERTAGVVVADRHRSSGGELLVLKLIGDGGMHWMTRHHRRRVHLTKTDGSSTSSMVFHDSSTYNIHMYIIL